MGNKLDALRLELAARSGIANLLEISDELVNKVAGYMADNAKRAKDLKGWVVHDPNGYKPSTYTKTDYHREFDAKRKAAKLGGDYTYSKTSDYVANTKYHLVKNMLNPKGGWVVEATGTPGYMSVAFEAYHTM